MFGDMCHLNDKYGDIIYFTYCHKPHENNKTNNALSLLTSIVVWPKSDIAFLCAVELHCGPKTIKNMSHMG